MRKSSMMKIATPCICMLLACGGITNVIRPLFLSDTDEIKLGAKFKAEIMSQNKIYNDMSVVRYVDSLGQLIANAQNDRDTIDFTFTIIDSPNFVNAFAIPGGHVFVYSGLLKKADNAAEVAGVLAHEIGHITKYHSANALVQYSAVGLINQILFGDSSSAAGAVAQIVESLAFLKLSKNNEFQADSCAVAYTKLINTNPYGMKSFLGKLLAEGEIPKAFEPLSSHPRTSDRIAGVQNEINRIWSPSTDSTSLLYATPYSTIKSKI